MTINAPSDFATAEYDPRYRLPLYQMVFHDSLVATDFWSASLVKFNNLIQVRSLLEQLYNVPSMWNLDQQAIREYGSRIKKLNDSFAPIHKRVGDQPLTKFEWLTPDRMVQRTEFDKEIILTANLSDKPFSRIPPHCVEAQWFA